MISSIDVYAPCFCGSGKKYRFCCMSHINNLATSIHDAKVRHCQSEECAEKAKKIFLQGSDLLEKYEYDEAEKLFRQALELDPYLMNAYNNLALIYQMKGKLSESIDMLRKTIAESTMQEPFAMAFLAQLLYMKGEDAAAKNAACIAVSQERQSPYSVVKVCETLATLRLHREILDFVDHWYSIVEQLEEDCLFFAGVAAANLHNYARAKDELSAITLNSPRAALAQRYLTMLQNNMEPDSVSGDWLYFSPEHFLAPVNQDDLVATHNNFKKSRWIADMVEASLVENEKKRTGEFIDILRYAEHPSVGNFLHKIIDWPLADDKLRFSVLGILSSRGEITDEEASKILNQRQIKGQGDKSLLFNSVKLNPDLLYGGPLPDDCFEKYKELIEASYQEDPDYENLLIGFNELCKKMPDFFPFQYNRGNMLIGIGRIREAEVIFRQIAADHPEYFFAHAGIMNILNGEQRLDEAEEYIKKTEFPEEIHPDAFIAYYCACARHYLLAGMDREAKQIIAFIKNIDPKHREYLYTKKLIEGTRELSKILRSIKKLAKYAKLDE